MSTRKRPQTRGNTRVIPSEARRVGTRKVSFLVNLSRLGLLFYEWLNSEWGVLTLW